MEAERRDWWGARLSEIAAEVLVKAGLEALIASGILVTVVLGGLALVAHDLPMVLGVAGVLFPALFVVTVAAVVARRARQQGLLAERAQARIAGLEALVQQLRAVDLEVTALRCQGRNDPEQNADETRRDCARAVLRPIYNQMLVGKPGEIRVAFHEWDERGRHFRHVVGTPEFRPAERDAVAQLGLDSAAGRALLDGGPIVIPDISAPVARQQGWWPLQLQRNLVATIQVPVYRIGGREDGEWLGVISVDSNVKDVFTQADGNLILEFAAKLNLIYEAMFDPVGGEGLGARLEEP